MHFDERAYRKLDGAKSTTYMATRDVVEITPDLIVGLKEASTADPLKRARICLHRHREDPVQQMIIAHHRDTYTRPHRHRNKSESFHILEGRMAVILFDDRGAATRTIVLGPVGSTDPAVYRLSSAQWHTVIPLSEHVVFHEITSGPFAPGDGEEASWAPDEADASAVRSFKARLTASMPP
jgi:cupin fold WbuC family metalloprotein